MGRKDGRKGGMREGEREEGTMKREGRWDRGGCGEESLPSARHVHSSFLFFPTPSRAGIFSGILPGWPAAAPTWPRARPSALWT